MIQELRDRVLHQGYTLARIELPAVIREKVLQRDWEGLDQAMGRETAPEGVIFRELLNYAEFTEIEFILSIRSSRVEPDEDGIWHDDGSRVLAFSLSLSVDHLGIEGGRLEIRKRGTESEALEEIPTPPYGTMIVFATGPLGFEHKINRVIEGERVIIAGWCT